MQPMEVGPPGQQLMGVMMGASDNLQNASMKMSNSGSVKVQQQRQLLQAVSCFEMQNRYLIYDGPTDESTPIFYIQEGSLWWERMCCPPDCKPWRMTYHNIDPAAVVGGIDPEKLKQYPAFLHIERPCSLTCCCLNRPEALITEGGPGGRLLGKLKDPWCPCFFTFEIADPAGQPRLDSRTCVCQKGTLCPCPGCTIDFPINDKGDGHQVAQITKTWMWGDCCPLCFKDWDNNVIHFGEASNPDYKMLLITLATFIQMRYFDGRNQS